MKFSLLFTSLQLLALTAFGQAPTPSPAFKAPTVAPFKFILPWDDNSESITNLAKWLESPAGKNGFISSKQGHLYSGSKRVRLLGVNIVGAGNFPTRED